MSLGGWVYYKSPRSSINRIFFLLAISTSILVFSSGLESQSLVPYLTHLFLTIEFAAASIAAYFFLLFCLRFHEVLSEQRESIRGEGRVLSEMRDMVYEGREYLLKGLLDDFGRLLNKGWELKKSLAKGITNPQIEEIHERALRAGALGGKICGAGGRGFLLLYCPFEKQDKVRDALGGPRELSFHFERDGTKAIFNIRR